MTTQLTNAASLLLKNALSAPGWAESIASIYTAGKILVEKLNQEAPENLEDKEWAAATREYEFSANDVLVIKECFEKLAANKSLSANNLSLEIITKLSLAP